MLETVVLTIIGNDRPGLIDALSAVVVEHEGTWEESRMAHLANKFAGILLVRLPAANTEKLLSALAGLDATGVLQVTAEKATTSPVARDQAFATLQLTGQDHPGIVQEVTHVIARLGVSVDEFETQTEAASMAGSPLFVAKGRLALPGGVSVDDLRSALEAIADDLMVDISPE